MVSTRPYLIRAIHEWAQDNNLTPHLVVDTTQEDVTVPSEYIEDDKIVLNIAASAVMNLTLGDEFITFNARFGGVAREIFVPTSAVRAVYAKENGIGIVLPDEPEHEEAAPAAPSSSAGPTGSKVAHLKIIK